jgi:hypothetical protein
MKNILVSVVDVEKLSNDLTKWYTIEVAKSHNSSLIPKPLEKNEKLFVNKFALTTTKSGKNVVLDNECVHNVLELPKFEVEVYSETLDENEILMTKSLFPLFSIRITVDELKKDYIVEDTLKNFMGNRFEYNSRIKSNMNILLKTLEE